MKVEQIYTGCLAQGAYYIESNGEAAIIDPLREVAPYLEKAAGDNAQIKYVFETHFHADFVSGHVTLSQKTGAPIVYGPTAEPGFEAHIAQDQEEFTIGALTLRVLHTPGHTLESTTYLLLDAEGIEYAIFTGDTLFLGDVGRPDLAQKSGSMTMEDLAGMAYDSLRNKIMPLPDSTLVYPAHGAGSACGKNMMKQTVDTLGNQKKMNYALRADMTKEEFINEVTDGLAAPPAYFPMNVKMNKQGYEDFDDVKSRGITALSPDQFYEAASNPDVLILDVRKPGEYAQGHIPGSIFVGLDGSFAPWVGELLVDTQQKILLIVPEDRREEAVTRLSRVGFDHTLGCLQGGITAWMESGREIDRVVRVSADDFSENHYNDTSVIYDVRRPSEFNNIHLPEAKNVPLSDINNNMDAYTDDETFYIHCAGGYRSMIASSILKARGIHNMIDVEGGMGALKKTILPHVQSEDAACTITKK